MEAFQRAIRSVKTTINRSDQRCQMYQSCPEGFLSFEFNMQISSTTSSSVTQAHLIQSSFRLIGFSTKGPSRDSHFVPKGHATQRPVTSACKYLARVQYFCSIH